MGMSTNVLGLRDPNDPKHKAMLEVLQACRKAKTSLPKEVNAYFSGDDYESIADIDPDAAIEVGLDKILKEWKGNESEGYELRVSDLPQGVKILRFYNSW